MNQLHHKQQGFSAVVLVLVIVVIGLLGVIGWLVINKNQTKNNQSATNLSSSNQPNSNNKTSSDTLVDGFDTSKITNYDKIPSGARPLVIDQAKKFSDCPSNPTFEVAIAQPNFVDVGMSCDGGGQYRFGMKNGTWSFLGSGAVGLGCDDVHTYGITKKSLINYSPATCTDFNSPSGGSEDIPD